MNTKLLLCICLACFICGCSAKNNVVGVEQSQDVKLHQSILNAPELEFAKTYGDVFKLTEPEKLLKLTEEQLLKAQNEQQDTTALLVLSGLIQSQLGNKDEAFDDLTKAVQLHSNAEIYALRALVLWRGGKARGAMRDAEYALLKQSDLPLAKMVQGLVYYSESEVDKACEVLNNACKQGQCYGLEFVQDEGACK